MAHSPFPWKTHPSVRTGVFDANGKKVAGTMNGHKFFDDVDRDTAEANAALIASIPDMVKALEGIEQRANESGTGEMGLLETVHSMARISRAALAAYRSSQK